jgi:hypothetical protein
MKASFGVLGLPRKHTAGVCYPIATLATLGGYGRDCIDHPVPETIGSRLGHDKRDGKSHVRHPVVAMGFSPLPRREREAYVSRRAVTGGAAIISDECVRGLGRGLMLTS